MHRAHRSQKPHPTGGGPSALDLAVASRDSDTLKMVAAALHHKEVLLAFQPVVAARPPHSVAFYEGLIRVLDDTSRVIPAKEFITTIEETELGRILDCVALDMGLRCLARVPGLRLSLNMSARSIGYPRWIKTLRKGLQANPTVGERLILEVSETSAMLVPEILGGFMLEYQRKGISFALDQFGAGATSLRYLREFYFDILKIDGQFIRAIAKTPDNQVLTKALLAIAHQFDMFTVAENVESAADATWLAAAGVDCQQGYFHGAPTLQPPWQMAAQAEQARA